MKGFVQIDRDDFENELWNEKRQYSRFEAFIYLVKSAIHDDEQVTIGRRKAISCNGQVVTSLRTLGSKWKWSANKVKDFLKGLRNRGYITIEIENNLTVISIVDFEKYIDL